MTPIRPEVIQRKLGTIIDNLQALLPLKGMPLETYRKDLFRRKATERLLQELIEAAIDINTHLIIQQRYDAPEDYYQSFTKLGEIGVLPVELAQQLAPSAGLRNRLVHRYDDLEDALIRGGRAGANSLSEIYSGRGAVSRKIVIPAKRIRSLAPSGDA